MAGPLIDFILFHLTVDPASAQLVAILYEEAVKAWRRNRQAHNAHGGGFLRGNLDRLAGFIHGRLLDTLEGRQRVSFNPELDAQLTAEARERLAPYLRRVTVFTTPPANLADVDATEKAKSAGAPVIDLLRWRQSHARPIRRDR